MWSETWKLYLGMVDGLGNLGGTASGPQALGERSIEVGRWGEQGARVDGVG